ncbi:hypothetical protein B481_0723 [Planococcus halocryophilus Or1]|nr:hypothetical protein B481_0723 [Planococcus halocryophilus Or1]
MKKSLWFLASTCMELKDIKSMGGVSVFAAIGIRVGHRLDLHL